MSIEFILGQIVSIQDRLSQTSSLNGEETQRLTGIFQRINTCSLLTQDREAILSLQGRVTQSPQTEDLQKIFLLLLKNSSDETIAHFLGLNTWQSRGNITEAKRLIIECVREMKVFLSLSDLGLTSLPPGIGHLIHLQAFHCADNHLMSLPAGICKLIQLQDLNCASNMIFSLPVGLSQLTQLESLN